ncbi:MAG: DMT family transporter [Gammaproteobacteria bacterium]|nr:DMT family transporter [Gammaproteobacteria bacterium]
MRPTWFDWLLLSCLIMLWGTSFMVTAVAVESVSPLGVVAIRVILGAAVLLPVVFLRGHKLPGAPMAWAGFLLMAVVGNLLPFYLIAWGQQRIDSGIAGVLMAIMPLVTMLLAHFYVPGERLNLYKISGFILGITGVILLLGPTVQGSDNELLRGLAVLAAAACYAINTILARRLPGFNPLIAGTGVLLMATFVVVPLWVGELFNLERTAFSWQSILALVWLGIAPTGLATMIYFAVIERAGPSFLSNINYLIPVVAYFTGVWVLSEPLTTGALIALTIILAGIALTRYRP